jgi:hypothetical protein
MQLISYWVIMASSVGYAITDVYAAGIKLSAYENDLYLGWMQQIKTVV